MSKENSSFLNKVNNSLNTVRNDVAQRKIQVTNEDTERERKETLREKEHIDKVEATKIDFTRLGVVAAFNEVIESRFLFISDEPVIKNELVYNFFGKITGKRKVEIPNYIPAYIDYDVNSIKLVVEEHSDNDPSSYSDYSYVKCEQYLFVDREDNGKFSLGFLGTNGSGRVEAVYKEIRKIECDKNMLFENLTKLIAVYKELKPLKQKCSWKEMSDLEHKNLLPHFP